jgi:hypothetical protein
MSLCDNMAEKRNAPAKPSGCMYLHLYYKEDNTKEHTVWLVIAVLNLNRNCLLHFRLFYGGRGE